MLFPKERRRYKPATLHRRACRLLGIDPAKVHLVGPSEFKAITGVGVGRNLGEATAPDDPQQAIYVRRGQPLLTYIHELLHVLFPSRPHWWVFAASEKVDPDGNYYAAWYTYRYAMREPVESRAKILRLARASAKRRGLAPDGQ